MDQPATGGLGRNRPEGGRLNGWRLERVDGLSLVRAEALERLPGVAHAFSTRLGPEGAAFDLGEPFAARRGLLLGAAGLAGQRPLVLRQVHGNRVLRAGEVDSGGETRADGIVATMQDPPGLAPTVRWADCVPILLAGAGGRAVAAVHAGWRGTAAGIATRAVRLLEGLGISARELVVALGPAIGACCYEVGEEVLRRVAEATGVGPSAIEGTGASGPTLDLRQANRLQLESAGVPAAAIHVAPWCTACRGDLFFSHRRERGRAGRQMACIGRKADAEGSSPA